MTESDAGTLGTRLYAEADASRGVGIARLLHPACEMYFNDGEPAVGPRAVEALVAERHRAFESITHLVRRARLLGGGSGAVLETEVTYRLEGGGQAIVSGCSILEFEDQLLTTWRIHADLSPLIAAMPPARPNVNHHVGVRVSDITAAIGFYRAAFEARVIAAPYEIGGELAEVVTDGPPGVHWQTAMVRIGDGVLELIEFGHPRCPMEPAHTTKGNIVHLAADVEDVGETLRRVESAGGKRLWPSALELAPGTEVIYVADPDGNVIELFNASVADLTTVLHQLHPASVPVPSDEAP